MNKKLLELLNAINEKKGLVQKLAEEGKLEDAAGAKEELKKMQQKFDLLKDIETEEMENAADRLQDTGETSEVKPVSDGAKDAVKEFANAARAGFRVSNVGISTGARESSDEDGGYIVPDDIQTQINEWKQAEFSLESLISTENVKTAKGSRTYEKKSEMTGFTDIEEGGTLPEMDTPKFERIQYTIQDRGGWLPLTNNLLNDTDQNITAVITKWIARKSNATSNAKILALLDSKAGVEIETMDEVKKAIIVTLGAAYRDGSQIITNDDGLFWLATLKDTTGRDLLQPNPMDVMQMYLSVGPLKVPVVAVPNQVIKSDKKTAGKNKIPLYCGDLKEAVRKYDRQRTELMSSNVASAGSLNAFTQNLTLVRAIERNAFCIMDNDAFVRLSMVTADSSVTGESSVTAESNVTGE
jgi:HK97 family phage major capsid protein